ncbi:MAG TPA: LytR C-terminal domain-containing protein [Acidimicrobiales bacterium]
MKPGRYAAADGSFGRSAGAAMGRGVILLGIALLIGVVLLNATDDQPPGTDVAAGTSNGTTEEKADDRKPAATTTVPPTTLPAKAPAEVKVLVANGSGLKGAAKNANDKVKAAQYNALAPTDGPATKETVIYYTAGFEREAAAVAGVLEIPSTLAKPMPTPAPFDTKTANVVVLLGPDHGTRFSTATTVAPTTTAAGSATTTTARPATTTTVKR